MNNHIHFLEYGKAFHNCRASEFYILSCSNKGKEYDNSFLRRLGNIGFHYWQTPETGKLSAGAVGFEDIHIFFRVQSRNENEFSPMSRNGRPFSQVRYFFIIKELHEFCFLRGFRLYSEIINADSRSGGSFAESLKTYSTKDLTHEEFPIELSNNILRADINAVPLRYQPRIQEFVIALLSEKHKTNTTLIIASSPELNWKERLEIIEYVQILTSPLIGTFTFSLHTIDTNYIDLVFGDNATALISTTNRPIRNLNTNIKVPDNNLYREVKLLYLNLGHLFIDETFIGILRECFRLGLPIFQSGVFASLLITKGAFLDVGINATAKALISNQKFLAVIYNNLGNYTSIIKSVLEKTGCNLGSFLEFEHWVVNLVEKKGVIMFPSVLLEKYAVIENIGSSLFYILYSAINRKNMEPVIIKEVRPEHFFDVYSEEKKLKHVSGIQGIPSLLDVFHSEKHYLIVERAQGIPLNQLLEARDRVGSGKDLFQILSRSFEVLEKTYLTAKVLNSDIMLTDLFWDNQQQKATWINWNSMIIEPSKEDRIRFISDGILSIIYQMRRFSISEPDPQNFVSQICSRWYEILLPIYSDCEDEFKKSTTQYIKEFVTEWAHWLQTDEPDRTWFDKVERAQEYLSVNQHNQTLKALKLTVYIQWLNLIRDSAQTYRDIEQSKGLSDSLLVLKKFLDEFSIVLEAYNDLIAPLGEHPIALDMLALRLEIRGVTQELPPYDDGLGVINRLDKLASRWGFLKPVTRMLKKHYIDKFGLSIESLSNQWKALLSSNEIPLKWADWAQEKKSLLELSRSIKIFDNINYEENLLNWLNLIDDFVENFYWITYSNNYFENIAALLRCLSKLSDALNLHIDILNNSGNGALCSPFIDMKKEIKRFLDILPHLSDLNMKEKEIQLALAHGDLQQAEKRSEQMQYVLYELDKLVYKLGFIMQAVYILKEQFDSQIGRRIDEAKTLTMRMIHASENKDIDMALRLLEDASVSKFRLNVPDSMRQQAQQAYYSTQPLIERYGNVDFPERTIVDQTYPMRIQIGHKAKTQKSPLLLLPPPELVKNIRLDVLVCYEHGDFTTDDPSNMQTLEISPNDDTPPLLFKLTPRKPGNKHIKVEYFHNSRYLGQSQINTQVDSGEKDLERNQAYSPPGQTTGIGLNIYDTTGPDAADLTIFLESIGENKYRFRLASSKKKLDYKLREAGEITIPYPESPEKFLESIYNRLNRFSKIPFINNELRFRTRMENIGNDLYDELFPDEFKALWWNSIRDNVQTILIISNETWIPWELICPYQIKSSNKEKNEFLCERYAITRWLAGECPPSLAMNLEKLQVLMTTRIRTADEGSELEGLLNLPGIQVTKNLKPSYNDVIQLFKLGGFDGLHLACHGKYDESNPNFSRLFLEDDENIEPDDLSKTEHNFGGERPLIFLNACSSGRSDKLLTGVGGWVKKLLDAGAGAFIGSTWDINHKSAAPFAVEFYSSLLKGKSLGEAARHSRLAARQTGDPSWLSYTIYGDPSATVISLNQQEKSEKAGRLLVLAAGH